MFYGGRSRQEEASRGIGSQQQQDDACGLSSGSFPACAALLCRQPSARPAMEGAGGAETSSDVEERSLVSLKVKTLDSRTYTVLVPKDISVPLLKERIALDTNVPPELQRLICRGKVLKDDQRLSEYNVEDGHVLHMVARLAVPAMDPAQISERPIDSNTAPSQGAPLLASIPGVTMRSLSVPVDAAGLPDINRMIATILNSFNTATMAASEGIGAEPAGNREANGQVGVQGQVNTPQGVELRIDTVYGLPSGLHVMHGPPFSLLGMGGPPAGQADSMAIMGQYLDRFQAAMQHSVDVSSGAVQSGGGEHMDTGVGDSNTPPARPVTGSTEHSQSAPAADSTSSPGLASDEPIPSRRSGTAAGNVRPAELVPLLQRVEGLLQDQVSDHLSVISRELEREQTVTDAAERAALQRVIQQGGYHLQQLGSLLQEMGRACFAVRLGSTPGDSRMRLGSSVFINHFGPNPMIIQPRRNGGAPQGVAAVSVTPPNVGPGPEPREAPSSTPSPAAQAAGPAMPMAAPVPPPMAVSETGPSNRSVAAVIVGMEQAGSIPLTANGGPVGFGGGTSLQISGLSQSPSGHVNGGGEAQASTRTAQLGATWASDPRGGVDVAQTPGQFGHAIFGPAVAQLQVQIGNLPAHVIGLGGQGSPSVMTFRPPSLAPQRDLNNGNRDGQDNHQRFQRGGGGATTAPVSSATPGAATPSELGREESRASSSHQRGEGGTSIQTDLAQFLSPLLRQLAGALNRVPESSPPPFPQAPPAAPPPPSQVSEGRASETTASIEPPSTSTQEIPAAETQIAQSETKAETVQNVPDIASVGEQADPSGESPLGTQQAAEAGRGSSEQAGPLGLVLGGLQPLPRPRRRTTARPPPKQPPSRGDAGESSSSTSAFQTRNPGAPTSQSMPTAGDRPIRVTPPGGGSPLDQLFGQMMSMQPEGSRQRSGANDSLGNIMQMLGSGTGRNESRGAGQDPIAGMLQTFSGEGGGIPGGLGDIVNQMMRNPAVNSMAQQMAERMGDQQPTLNNVMAAVSGRGGAGEGVDFGGMMAQMMPMVSQLMGDIRRSPLGPGGIQRGRASGASLSTEEGEDWKQALTPEELELWSVQIAEDEQEQAAMEPQRPLSDAYLSSSPAKRRKMAMDGTSEKLQGGAGPQEVLRSIAEVAIERMEDREEVSGGRACDGSELIDHIASTQGLAEAYVGVLWHDLAARMAADSDASEGERFQGLRALLSAPHLESNGAP